MVRPAQQTNRTKLVTGCGSPNAALPGPTGQDLLFDYRVLLALILWAVNDWLLKPTLGPGSWGIVTGKLSDIAGLVVLVATTAAFITALNSQGRLTPIGRTAALAIPAAALVALKTSVVFAHWYSSLLEMITGLPHQVVVDPTDLVALVALVPAARILAQPRLPSDRLFSGRVLKRRLGSAAIGLAVVAVAGASSYDYVAYTHLEVVDDQVVVHEGDTSGGNHRSRTFVLSDATGEWVSYSGEVVAGGQVNELCSTRSTDICVRGVGRSVRNRIEESTDGGQTWREVWHVNGRESWVRNLASSEGDLEITDMVETSDGRIVVAVGYLFPIIRSTDGAWSPEVADLRTFPLIIVIPLLAGAVAAMAGAVGRRLNRGWAWLGPIALGVASIWVAPFIYDIGPIGLLGFALTFVSAVTAVITVILLAVRTNFAAAALIPALAAVAVGTAVVPLLLWAVGLGSWNVALLLASGITSLFVLMLAMGRRQPQPPQQGHPPAAP